MKYPDVLSCVEHVYKVVVVKLSSSTIRKEFQTQYNIATLSS